MALYGIPLPSWLLSTLLNKNTSKKPSSPGNYNLKKLKKNNNRKYYVEERKTYNKTTFGLRTKTEKYAKGFFILFVVLA